MSDEHVEVDVAENSVYRQRLMLAWSDEDRCNRYSKTERIGRSVDDVGSNVGPLPDNFLMLWSEPVQMSSVLSSLRLRRLADIQLLTSTIHDFGCGIVVVVVKVQLRVIGEGV